MIEHAGQVGFHVHARLAGTAAELQIGAFTGRPRRMTVLSRFFVDLLEKARLRIGAEPRTMGLSKGDRGGRKVVVLRIGDRLRAVRFEYPLGKKRRVGVDLAGRDASVRQPLGPESNELLYDLLALAVRVAGRVAGAEAAIAQGVITQVAARVEVPPDLRLPSRDHAREQPLFSLPLEPVEARLDRLAEDLGGAASHLALDRLAIETHLGRELLGLPPPVNASPRGGSPLPVQPFDIIGIAPQVAAPRPKHRVVDMEPDGDLPLQGNSKGRFDEASYFSVGMVECQRTEDDCQLGLAPARGADPADDVPAQRRPAGVERAENRAAAFPRRQSPWPDRARP